MRRLHKEWSDAKPFTRRVRWYLPDYGVEMIRLKFEDANGTVSVFYGSDSAAQHDWNQFKNGNLDTRILRSSR